MCVTVVVSQNFDLNNLYEIVHHKSGLIGNNEVD